MVYHVKENFQVYNCLICIGLYANPSDENHFGIPSKLGSFFCLFPSLRSGDKGIEFGFPI
jgi:hypothetical protein